MTGAGGMLGRDVIMAAANAGVEAHALSHGELDITDAGAVAAAVAALAPEVIINCAAWTDVDDAAEQEEAAFAINATGPKVLAEAGTRLIHVSTDYVFAGARRECLRGWHPPLRRRRGNELARIRRRDLQQDGHAL